jgi:hypothetical protein
VWQGPASHGWAVNIDAREAMLDTSSMASLYFHLVPKDPIENLKWRIRCRERALVDRRFQDALVQACYDDVCFFMGFACIGKGTRVVTDRGPVPIESVKTTDLVWDGHEWVRHQGVLNKGRKATILAYKIKVTSDHKVWTTNGWQDASKRYDREDVPFAGGYSERWNLSEYTASGVAVPLPVREHEASMRLQSETWIGDVVWMFDWRSCDAWESRHEHLSSVDAHGSALHEPEQCSLATLRRSWNQGVSTLDVVRELLGGHGGAARRIDAGSRGKRRRLRARKLSVGNVVTADAQSAQANSETVRNVEGTDDYLRDHERDWADTSSGSVSNQVRLHAGTDDSSCTRVEEVYDILNCGERQCFTVLDADDRPLLVHNCWGYDPRAKHKIQPFIPHPHQESVFIAMDEAIDRAEREEISVDVIVDKARAQGGTFGYLWVDLRRWLRDPMFSAGYVTRNEDLVDSKTDSNTVMWKLAWGIELLPVWMQPQYERHLGQHSFMNKENGALLRGYSAGQDVAAGGRATVFTIDEAGARDFVAGGKDEAVQESLHDVTNCIRMVSARYVDQGVFHEACENPDSSQNGVHLVLDWKDHPVHGKNSYVVHDGKLVAVKPEDQEAVDKYHAENPKVRTSLERKGFKYDGRVRSPWYDMRCLRPTSTPRLIASQLDRNPRGAVGKVFTPDLLDRMKRQHCKPPVWQGTPVFDSETLKLQGLLPREDGPLKLWFKPGIDNTPPLGPFTVGCDIASGGVGAYSSNSVLSALDDRTGEQMVEYTIKGLEPRPFARRVVGLCMWLRNALLGWEDSGVSGGFAKEVMEVVYYGNVFFRDVAQLGSQKKSRKPGWPCRDADKADMFEVMALAMEMGQYVPRSEELITECGEYEWDGDKIVHAPTKNKGATDKNHADRAIAGGGVWLVYSRDNAADKLDSGEETGETAEYGSFKWREEQERTRVPSGSPDFGIRDVMGY